MSGVYIKNLKFPAACKDCIFQTYAGADLWKCQLTKKEFYIWEVGWGDGSDKPYIRHKDCPLLNINLPNKNENEEMSKISEMEMAYGEYLND